MNLNWNLAFSISGVDFELAKLWDYPLLQDTFRKFYRFENHLSILAFAVAVCFSCHNSIMYEPISIYLSIYLSIQPGMYPHISLPLSPYIFIWVKYSELFIFQLDCHYCFRSSLSQMFFEIGALQNFALFTGKQLCWSPFLNKINLKIRKPYSEMGLFGTAHG